MFDEFVERLAPGGALVVCVDDPGAAALAERSCGAGCSGAALRQRAGRRIWPARWSTGSSRAPARWRHVQLAGESHPRAMRLAVPGRHMALNALAALLAAVEAGAPVDDVLDGLAGFEGVRRRFELVGTAGGVRVFDDYAHHPTEVRAALTALRAVARRTAPGSPRRRAAASSCSSRTCIRAQRLSRASSATRWTPPTRCSCSTSTPPASSRWPGSAAPPSPSTSACRCTTCRTSPRSPSRWPAAAGRGDVVVTMGAGDVTMLGAGDHRGAAGAGGREPGDDAGAEPDARAGRRADAPTDGASPSAAVQTSISARRRRGPGTEPSRRAETPRPSRRTTSRARAGGPAGNARSAAPRRQRATAIEEARREAKRRVRGAAVERAETVGRRAVRGLKAADLAGRADGDRRRAGPGAVLHPDDVGALARRHRHRRGDPRGGRRRRRRCTLGTPLLQIDTDAVADRVAGIRRVASARVQREYPSTLRITIVERIPVGGQGLSRRTAPVRPGRRRLRDRAAAARAALHRRRQSRARPIRRPGRRCR